jgi:hypothetical protein
MMLNLLTVTLLAALQAPPATPTPSSPTEITAFVEALNSCTAARAATPHPLMRSFTVEHTISGPGTGGCNYRQTMPGKMAMVCALSPEGRKAMAAEIGVYAKGGPMSGSTSAAKPTWWSECQLEMPDGKRQPM